MARETTKWPATRWPITKIMSSDGCNGNRVPLEMGPWYDFREFGCHLGNVGYKHYDFTKVALISGTIWAVFHWPLLVVLMAPRLGVSPWPLLVFSLIAGIGLSTIMAWFRLRSGSVWTAILFNAALNIHNQGFFQNLTVETSSLTNYISGEHGLMLGLVSAAVGYYLWRRRGELPKSSASLGAESRTG